MAKVKPEFPRPVVVERIPPDGMEMDIAARPEERAALAGRFDLQALPAFSARVSLSRVRGGRMVEVRGRLAADVVQCCVVTLAPVPAHIEQDFSRLFAPPDMMATVGREIEVTPEGEEPPDPIDDGAIDIGEVAAEELALALEPFPRAPGAAIDPALLGNPPEDEEGARENPFAVLKRLQQKKG